MKHLKYKGYIGIVEFDFDDNLLYGKVANTNDLISFSGKDLAELKQSFEESIDSYIEICEEMGEVPEKPYNGRFQVRATPELHKELFIAALEEDMSLNGFVVQCLEESLKRRQTKQTMALPEQSKEESISLVLTNIPTPNKNKCTASHQKRFTQVTQARSELCGTLQRQNLQASRPRK